MSSMSANLFLYADTSTYSSHEEAKFFADYAMKKLEKNIIDDFDGVRLFAINEVCDEQGNRLGHFRAVIACHYYLNDILHVKFSTGDVLALRFIFAN